MNVSVFCLCIYVSFSLLARETDKHTVTQGILILSGASEKHMVLFVAQGPVQWFGEGLDGFLPYKLYLIFNIPPKVTRKQPGRLGDGVLGEKCCAQEENVALGPFVGLWIMVVGTHSWV